MVSLYWNLEFLTFEQIGNMIIDLVVFCTMQDMYIINSLNPGTTWISYYCCVEAICSNVLKNNNLRLHFDKIYNSMGMLNSNCYSFQFFLLDYKPYHYFTTDT